MGADRVEEGRVSLFFSLAAVRLFSSLILTMVSETKSLWVMSIGIGVVYEGFLTFGLAEWILSEAARDNLISANREGIASSLGYLALYLAGNVLNVFGYV